MLVVLPLFLIFGLLFEHVCQGSLYFDGNTRYAVISDYSLVNSIGSSEFSIQVWFKAISSLDTFSAFLSNRDCSCYDGFMYGFSTYDGGDSPWLQYRWNRFTQDYNYDYNQWHHSILTVGNDKIRIFVDNNEVYSVSWYDGYYSLSNSHSIWIGLDDGRESNSQYVGYLDDIAIWDRVLTLDEIEYLSTNSLYNNENMLNDNNLLHYFPLNRLVNNNQYIEDIVNGYDAYLGNSASTTTYDPSLSSDEPDYNTAAPTAPSQSPSFQPSEVPTTSYPTVSPSDQPSQQPTTPQPTLIPSSQPSKYPTQLPTNQPSQVPTTPNPTYLPSSHPSQIPSTVEPTQIPSYNPSKIPSNDPSQTPSNIPSSIPSNSPSKITTQQPSLDPTQISTAEPTTQQLEQIITSTSSQVKNDDNNDHQKNN